MLGLDVTRFIFSWLALKLAGSETSSSVASDYCLQAISLLGSFLVNFALYLGMVSHLKNNLGIDDAYYNYFIFDDVVVEEEVVEEAAA